MVGGVLVGALPGVLVLALSHLQHLWMCVLHCIWGANSCLNTANLLTVQQSTSCNLDTVVAPRSRRKVRPSPPIGTGSAVLTEDMSPAPHFA